MTNGEKIKEIFSNTKIITQYDNTFGDRFMVFTLNNEEMQVNIDWWNSEYKEPTTKNDLGVDTNKLLADCEKMSFDIEIFNKPLKVVALDAVKNIAKDLINSENPNKSEILTGSTTKNDLGVDREEAIEALKENLCAMCAYGSQCMESCDIKSCDNRDAIKALEQAPILDKIRAEIEKEADTSNRLYGISEIGLRKALKIIDKYKAETEET